MPISFASSRLILPLVLLSASLLSACSSTTGRAHAEGSAAQNATTSKDSLALTSWELVRWTRAGGQLREIPHGDNGEPITLVFLANDKPYQISGFAGLQCLPGNLYIARRAINNRRPGAHTHGVRLCAVGAA